jgi:hypothetical protein
VYRLLIAAETQVAVFAHHQTFLSPVPLMEVSKRVDVLVIQLSTTMAVAVSMLLVRIAFSRAFIQQIEYDSSSKPN